MEFTKKILEYHCEMRKYACKANSWYGINIDPQNLSIKFGVELDYPWEWSKTFDEALTDFSHGTVHHTKIGRNSLCPCGSGKKFKKCCIGKDIYV
jgi:preprotein translocase subunit SecA